MSYEKKSIHLSHEIDEIPDFFQKERPTKSWFLILLLQMSIILFSYLFFSFIFWSLNPVTWNWYGRLLMILFYLFQSYGTYLFYEKKDIL